MADQLYKSYFIALLGLSLIALPVQAISAYLNFNSDALHSDDANISYNQGDVLYGSNIKVDSVRGFYTPLNANEIYEIEGSLLNFSTGPLISYAENMWTFGPGGTISIVSNDSTITWMNGIFQEVMVESLGTNTFKVMVASFWDEKIPVCWSTSDCPPMYNTRATST